MTFANLYDSASAGFDFRGAWPLVLCAFVLLVLAVVAFRKPSERRIIRTLILGAMATAIVVAGAGVALEYRNYRLDLEDLAAGRAPVVEGIVHDHELRHGSERFKVDSIALMTRTSVGGYGMQKGALTVEDGMFVRIHYSLRTHHRRHAILRFEAPINPPPEGTSSSNAH
jgi:hypothetical protein